MPSEECVGFKEFPVIIEAKDCPIHAWLTHPEAAIGHFYRLNDPATDEGRVTFTVRGQLYTQSIDGPTTAKRRVIAKALSDSFTALCREYAENKPAQELNPDLHLVLKADDAFILPPGSRPMAYSVQSLECIRKQA